MKSTSCRCGISRVVKEQTIFIFCCSIIQYPVDDCEWELAGHQEHETKPLNGNNDSFGAHKTTESNNKISF